VGWWGRLEEPDIWNPPTFAVFLGKKGAKLFAFDKLLPNFTEWHLS